MNIKLKVKYDPEWEEWKVAYYEDGVYNEDKTYYALDESDAVGTARLMANEAYRMGARTVEVLS